MGISRYDSDMPKEDAERRPYKRVAQVDPEKKIRMVELLIMYWCYAVLIFFGHVYEIANRVLQRDDRHDGGVDEGYAPLYEQKEYFFIRRIYGRNRDCWDRPITGCPGRYVELFKRRGVNLNQFFVYSGETKRVLNMGSYNYLGFAQTKGTQVDAMLESLKQYGTAAGSTPLDVGYTAEHRALEERIAQHVGKEAAFLCGMGYLTNSGAYQALVGKGDLIISDSLNHASIVAGCRITGAKVQTFEHNEPADLERVVRQAIALGHARTHRPYRRILIVVEGIYSMEGDILRLPEIVAIKNKYKCLLFVDEAHSIGALGEHGRGICEHTRTDPRDVDFLMGTFTKSFASVGGYIASDRRLIDHLRATAFSQLYAVSMATPTTTFALSALTCIMGVDGTDDGAKRLDKLLENTHYFRRRMREMGFSVMGQDDSPVVPVLLVNPCKLIFLSRMLLQLGLAAVVVGHPATPPTTCRARFCMSASYTKDDLDRALKVISDVGDLMMIKLGDNLSIELD